MSQQQQSSNVVGADGSLLLVSMAASPFLFIEVVSNLNFRKVDVHWISKKVIRVSSLHCHWWAYVPMDDIGTRLWHLFAWLRDWLNVFKYYNFELVGLGFIFKTEGNTWQGYLGLWGGLLFEGIV